MTTEEGNGTSPASRSGNESGDQWSHFLRRAITYGKLDALEAAVWTAAARYAESPSPERESELIRAAQAFGIEPPG